MAYSVEVEVVGVVGVVVVVLLLLLLPVLLFMTLEFWWTGWRWRGGEWEVHLRLRIWVKEECRCQSWSRLVLGAVESGRCT